MTATSSENITGFDASDITVGNGTASNFAVVDAKTFRRWTGWSAWGYISGADVFFDANFNGVLDEGENFSITLPDGSYDLFIDMDEFDRNQNGELDPDEGRIVVTGGEDISTNLPNDTFSMALPGATGFTMVTPFTTLIAQLVQQGMSPEEAEAQVKAALGLPDSVDLTTYDHLAAMGNGEAEGLALYSADVQILNTIVQTAQFMSGASEMSLVQLSEAAIGSLSALIQEGNPIDLTNIETIQAIVSDAILKAAEKDPNIDPAQLSEAANAVAEMVVSSNQIVTDSLASGDDAQEIALGNYALAGSGDG